MGVQKIQNIVIEGIDCAGKSTLAKELKTALGWDMRFLGHKNCQSQFLRYLKEYGTLEQTIIERSHVSESLYGKLFGRESPFSKSEEEILDGILAETALVIACVPPLALARERYAERTHVRQIITSDTLAPGHEIFEHYFDARKKFPNILRYESKNFDELESLVSKIVEIVQHS